MAAEALRDVRLAQDGILVVLDIVLPVAEGQALGLEGLLRPILPALFPHAGVHEKLSAVLHLDGGAGEAARLVIALIRSQGRGQIVPVEQVRAHRVTPVHGAPLGGVGVILIEHMELPLVEGKAVGVVHPADTRG